MTDIMTPDERSARMSRIHGKDTKPELLVRKYLHGRGLRYRLHGKGLPGRPDLVLPKYRAVIFVDGCFWHGHACQKGRVPGTNPDFWKAKISANQARDRRTRRALLKGGWRVIRVWECLLSAKKARDKVLARLEATIRDLPTRTAA